MTRKSELEPSGPEKFDSRFDPRFQPGYQEQPGDLPVTSTISASPTPEMLIPPPPSVDAQPSSHLTDAETAVSEPVNELELEANPFERTLWIVAAVLIVVGVAIAYWASSLHYMGDGSDWSWPQMLQSSAWALSAPMVTVGLATAVGLLFRRAITWKPPE